MGISFAVLRQLCVVMVSTAHYQLWAVLEQFLVALVCSGEAPEYLWGIYMHLWAVPGQF